MIMWFNKLRKGAAPMLVAVIVVIAFVTLDIFDKDGIYQSEHHAALNEKSAYSVIHAGELYERTIDTAIYFSTMKSLYTIGNASVVWTKSYPDGDELAEILEGVIIDDIKVLSGKIDNKTIPPGELNLELSYTDEGIVVEGSIPFEVSYVERDFRATIDSYGKFRHKIPTRYFKMAEIARAQINCPSQGRNEVVDDIEIYAGAGVIYEVVVTDLLDPNGFGEGNLEISFLVDCDQ